MPDGQGVTEPDPRIAVVEADLAATDRPDVRDAAVGADVVFNLAGQVSHVDSMDDPLFDLDVNTTSQFRFLELLRRENPSATVVYTSTRQIFGKPRYLPVDEEHPVAPVDVNGITKYATEQLHLLYHDVYGLAASAVRLTNVFGPRQRLRDDLQGFLPIFLRRALADDAITVFGDGAQERDCLYVDDVVECLLLTAAVPDAAGEIFNVGNDERLSLGAIAEAVVTRDGDRPGRARALAAGPRRHRHRVVLRRFLEGEADAGLGAAHVVRRRHRAHGRLLPRTATLVPVTDDGRPGTPRVPVVDLRRRAQSLEPELSDAVARVVRSGSYLLGPELDAFEAEFAAFTGRRHAVGVASGTDALRLSFTALGIGPGDEVIVPGVHRGAHRGRGVRGRGHARLRRRRPRHRDARSRPRRRPR